MKSKYILAIGYLAALSFSSCGDDFLGKEPQGALTPDALANPTGVELLTVSAYAGLAVPVLISNTCVLSGHNFIAYIKKYKGHQCAFLLFMHIYLIHF